jgi:transcriptional regulator with XRE-family HTH domain
MFRTRLIQFRKAQNLTQQALADAIAMHVNQVKRYEAGTSQPTLDVLVRLAKVLHVSLDTLVFEESERGPSDELALQFEAVSHMSEDERYVVKALLDSMILQHEARRWALPPAPNRASRTTNPTPDSQRP